MWTLGPRPALTRRSWRADRTSCCITRSRSTSTRGESFLHSIRGISLLRLRPHSLFYGLTSGTPIRSCDPSTPLLGWAGRWAPDSCLTRTRCTALSRTGWRDVPWSCSNITPPRSARCRHNNTTATPVAATFTAQQQVIHALSLPIPCPSGDQRLVSPSERHVSTPNDESSTAPASREVAPDDGQPLSAYEPSGHYCVRWAQQPPTGDLVRLPTDTNEPARVVAMSGGAYTSLGDADGDTPVLAVRRRIAISQ